MNLAFDRAGIALHVGHAPEVLRSLPEDLARTCVTSPPYWGLRDYHLPPAVWGGAPMCEHSWGRTGRLYRGGGSGGGEATRGRDQSARIATCEINTGAFCFLCGAWLGCLGLEPTPDLYVTHLVDVLREVRRTLRSDGTLWLNLGDTFATGAGSVGSEPGGGVQGGTWAGSTPQRGERTRALRDGRHSGKHTAVAAAGPMTQPNRLPLPGFKPKDLVGIPWRVALALQADGWWLRSDIVWAKPNPMPESVRDRPTRSHEFVFLLSKSERYFYDVEAGKEPAVGAKVGNKQRKSRGAHGGIDDNRHQKFGVPWPGAPTRNRRSVWNIATRPFHGSHFAVMPEDLADRCVRIGSRPGDIVLDPFAGSGTVLAVAAKSGRRAIGVDLNPDYCSQIAAPRLEKATPTEAPAA